MRGKKDVPGVLASCQGGLSMEPGSPMARGASPQRGASGENAMSRQALVLEHQHARENPRVHITGNSTPSASHGFSCLLFRSQKPVIGVQHTGREKA